MVMISTTGDGRGHFARGFMHCCRSGKTLLALRALWGYDGQLRRHQARALERFPEVLTGPRRKCMMVFSTLPVLQQFLASTLKTATEEGLVPGAGSVVMVCSASDDIQSEWCRKVEDQKKVERILQTDERVLFVTTYASAYKIDLALRATESSLDLAVFDEAHSVHTAKRYFLWGGGEGDEEEDDAGGGDAPSINIEAETSSDAEGEDAGLRGEDCRGALTCSEASVLALEQRYPRRLYLTATPSKRMQRDDALVRRVYGTPDGDWDVFKFSDLLKAQREYAKSCVKEFDVRILVNGKPKDCKESAEFYDKVCVLREIAEAGVQNNKMSRVLMYHALASARSGARSAENYGNQREWQRALTHVKRKGKGRYAKLNFKDFEIYAVRGEDADVQEKLARFNSLTDDGKIHILCSCRVFGEGVTLERCDMTVFADGKRSPKDIVQSGLRGVKFDEAKPEARLKILLLTNLDGETFHEKTNPVEISEEIVQALRARDKMEPLALVLAALKEEDDEFSEEVMAMLPRSPRRCGTKDEGSDGQGSDGQDAENIDEDPERGHSTGETQTESVSVASDGDFITETQLDSVADIKDKASRHSTRRGADTNRFSIRLAPDLFLWKAGDETVSRIEDEFVSSMTIELCSLNTSAKWERMFQELLVYRQEHGDCIVPRLYKPNLALGRWVISLRQIHKAGKLALDRKERLESISFDWDPLDSYWEQKFQELLAYRQEHGNCIVPHAYEPNPALGKWVTTLRQTRKAGKLASGRKERLESIGFDWDPLDSAWEQKFQELLAYRQEHSNCNVPQAYKPNPTLGIWVRTLRRTHKAGKLASDHKERLESISFDWNLFDSYWEQKFQELIAYRQEHGNCNVPRAYNPNPALGKWVTTLRGIHQDGKLASERKEQLESISFDWDPVNSSWEEKFQELLVYRQEHGDCNVIRGYKSNPALGLWVNHIRQNYKADKLASDRKERLESIGFVWNLRREGAARVSSKECVLSKDPELAKSLSTKRRLPGVDGAVHALPPKKPRLTGTASMRSNHEERKHKGDSGSPPSLEDASQAFRNACANAEAEAEQPAKKLRKMTKTYDASSFSIAHVNFKNNVLSMLLAGCAERDGLRAAFLDDFAEDGVTLRTTQKLLETGRFAPRDLYCANPNHKVVEALRSIGVNAAPGVFVEAAQEWKREDSDRRFDLAYVDLCTGSADEVQKNLEAVLPSMAETSVLAYTITGRSGSDKVPEGEHDHTWHMMGPRMQRILRSVEKDPYNFELVGTLPGRKLGDVKQASEIFFSDGARGARVCTVLFKRGPGS